MSKNREFSETLRTTAERVADTLKKDGETTSWELKMKLRMQSSLLYMALGRLESEGRLSLCPDELTYRVKLTAKPAENEKQAVS